MSITKKYLSRRTMLRGTGVIVGLPFLDSMIPALQGQIAVAKKEKKDFSVLAKLLEAVIAVLALIGMLSLWRTELVLMEISFFHFHGTGRPPQDFQVQSLGPGFAFNFQR